jgi:hypothetical protein
VVKGKNVKEPAGKRTKIGRKRDEVGDRRIRRKGAAREGSLVILD